MEVVVVGELEVFVVVEYCGFEFGWCGFGW